MTIASSLSSLSPMGLFLRYSIFISAASSLLRKFFAALSRRAGYDSFGWKTNAAAPWGRCYERRRTIGMKKPILGMAFILASACSLTAQEASNTQSAGRATENVAAPFSDTSAAQANLFETASSESRSLTPPAPGSADATPIPAAPAPKPNFIYGNRDDYRWQLALGVGFYRFQSNIINASLVGTNTTVSYWTNGWFAVEGNIVTGFAPEILQNEHVKYFGGGGGIRVGGRRNRFEPWVHALVGGAHLQPQTADNSRSAFSAQAGIGLDYRLHSRFSVRLETDWVHTSFFNQTQNNFQSALDVVFHF
jgi:opacity protein-like surface antigen